MAALHGHRAFGGHAGVADDVAALHLAEAEALGDFLRQAHALEDLDALAGAHDAHVGGEVSEGGAHALFIAVDLEHRGAGVLEPVQGAAQAAFQRSHQVLPAVVGLDGLQGQLDPAVGHFIAVDGEAGAVRTTVGHGFEHRLEQFAELAFQLGLLQVKTYDSAHGVSPWGR
ncbi:hypothetical protein D9M68_840200 [compost metagenome]